jgi:hypothetical protein
MTADRRTAAADDDRGRIDGERLEDRPDQPLGELVEQAGFGRGAQDGRLAQHCLCS